MPTPDVLACVLLQDEFAAVLAVVAAARAARSLIIEGGDDAAVVEMLGVALAAFDDLFPETTAGGDL